MFAQGIRYIHPYTDTSYQGIGAVLSTERDGEEQPIGYYSKQLSQAERSYAATEIECLAVVKSVSNFAIHLLGRPFSIVKDHHALTSLMSSSKLNSRLVIWALALQDYSFTKSHRAGNMHQNADGLSRQAWYRVFISGGGGVGFCPHTHHSHLIFLDRDPCKQLVHFPEWLTDTSCNLCNLYLYVAYVSLWEMHSVNTHYLVDLLKGWAQGI